MNLNFLYFVIAIIIALLVYFNFNSKIPEIDTSLASKLIEDENHVFLDVRTDSEYKNGHIKNSYHIPLQSLQNRIQELEVFQKKNIIVYCRSGARSSKATKLLSQNNFNVKNLIGGILKWEGELVE
jgi:rhodanese-related sulfurtransferase